MGSGASASANFLLASRMCRYTSSSGSWKCTSPVAHTGFPSSRPSRTMVRFSSRSSSSDCTVPLRSMNILLQMGCISR